MNEFKEHAEKLVREFKQKRAMILSKRRKLTMNTEEDRQLKLNNYKRGLKCLSEGLIQALEEYKEVFTSMIPEVSCIVKIKSRYPDDIDINFSINNYTIRFLTRLANKGEEFQRVLVDGMLFAETTYQGGNRKMEAQIGLWSDIGLDAWGVKSDEDEFLYFLKDVLPDLIESLWNNATLTMVHSH